ncbi:hypothetical protein LYNGBM3L_10910 [Moorena producens 3L]|uniref:Transposase n=1 Tax=Moorena producens 3L TaxID=489825 RepID=F4XK19_9CYAN|nr:hypothetical protein LYNGBM3L_10910 [Moorena producens 3L]
MFRDFKSGGYNLENTKVEGKRFISIVLLISIAYTSATFKGQHIKRKGIQSYVGRVKEYGRMERRHSGATQGRVPRPWRRAPSSFYVGLYGQTWIKFKDVCLELVTELMKLNPNKRKYYQRGLRAMSLIESAF